MNLRVSHMAENLIGSEIIKLGNEINQRIREGASIYNLTIGDFNPDIFPILQYLTEQIIECYREGHTNYPPADGLPELRAAVARFMKKRMNLDYPVSSYLIAGGARPIIYSIYQTIVDPGDKVIFPVPSWNNNHYCHLSHATPVLVEAKPENNFMPVRQDLEPHVKDAVLIAVCSPLNPTGTVFSREQLKGICDLVMEENARRPEGSKPLYLMYDQIYWALTLGGTTHYNPVEICPEIAPYTIFVDGISKAFAATGVRVGWTFGPEKVISKMKSILGHIGAWAPKAEQLATARFLEHDAVVDAYLHEIRNHIADRLNGLYHMLDSLSSEGYPIEVIKPEGAIYLTVKFSLMGKVTETGPLESTMSIAEYLIKEASFAIVPFTAFGSGQGTEWFRISVGTCRVEDIPSMKEKIKSALDKLQ